MLATVGFLAECIERHVVGAVADGVEAELEAGGGALGGHLVEVVLLVARDAGVGGLVVVGRFHGGGAAAERAVHEALEHAEVQQRVVEVVAGAALLEVADGEVEVDPLVDAEGEFVFVLEAFEDEPVVPVGEVLHGGDAVGECVADGELRALRRCRRWAAGCVFRRGRGGRFADDAGGLAVRVAIDVAAEGIGCGGVDARGCEGGGVGDGDVAVDAIEKGGVGAGDGVEVLACGKSFRGPLGVVPAAAEDPCCGSSSVLA